jgi:hypothetical protein
MALAAGMTIVAAVGLLAAVAPASLSAGGQREARQLATVREWRADVIVTSDCDRKTFDGSWTSIHNRIATTYRFSRRVTNAAVPTWAGRASTTYRWSVEVGSSSRRDLEESLASFESDAKLELTGATKISVGRRPGRPFTRKRYLGDLLLENATSDDEPPAAELFEAPLPVRRGTMEGSRMEDGYAMLGGALLPCPAYRQWTIRAAS